jgi:hypothetical protein
VAVGAPARVIKRFDFETRKWVKIPDQEVSLEGMVDGVDEDL